VAKRNTKRRVAQILAGNPWLYAGICGIVKRATKALCVSDLSRIDFLATDERHVNTRFHFGPSRGWIGPLERR
jgi:hypothetical protein